MSGTTHAHTLHKTQNKKIKKTGEKEKREEKKRQQEKAKYTNIKQRKARKNIVLVNQQLIFSSKNPLQLLLKTFLKEREP